MRARGRHLPGPGAAAPAGPGPGGTRRGARRGPNNADGPRGPGVSPAAAPSALRGRVDRRPGGGRAPGRTALGPRCSVGPGGAPSLHPSAGGAAGLRGPGRPPAPHAGVVAAARVPFAPRGSGGTPPTSAGPRWGGGAGGGACAARGRPRDLFLFSEAGKFPAPRGAGSPRGSRAALAEFFSRLRRRRVPRKETGRGGVGDGRGNDDSCSGGGRRDLGAGIITPPIEEAWNTEPATTESWKVGAVCRN